jgi:hypothetical protein
MFSKLISTNFFWWVLVPLIIVALAWIAGTVYVCFKPHLWPKLFGQTHCDQK